MSALLSEPFSWVRKAKKERQQSLYADVTKPVFFWKESDPDHGYLSQWYECPFTDEKDPTIVYRTAEHYMMYHKALLFNDHATAAKILVTQKPRKVKTLGRNVANFDETLWTAHRLDVARAGNIAKFTRAVSDDGLYRGTGTIGAAPLGDKTLRDLLLATGDAELVEASPFDQVWGIGFNRETAAGARAQWGENLLGEVLMDVREQFQNEDEAERIGEVPAIDQENEGEEWDAVGMRRARPRRGTI